MGNLKQRSKMPSLNKGMGEDKYKEAIKAIFDEVDANKDNVLQVDEFKMFCIRIAEESGHGNEADFEALRSKAQIHWQSLFNLIDMDHSGALDWDEIWKDAESQYH